MPKERQLKPLAEAQEVRCPDCKLPLLQPMCFCEECRSYWAFEVVHRTTNTWDRKWGQEPRRGCPDCGGEVTVFDGYCYGCEDFRAPRLQITCRTNRASTWNVWRWQEIPWDPALDRRCTKEENLAGLAACKAALGRGPMAQAVRRALDEVPF